MDGFFGFLFLVCMPSFFIVNGLLTWNHPWDNVYFRTLVSHLGFLVNIDTNRTQQPSGPRIIRRGYTVHSCACVCVWVSVCVCVCVSVWRVVCLCADASSMTVAWGKGFALCGYLHTGWRDMSQNRSHWRIKSNYCSKYERRGNENSCRHTALV